MLILSRHFPTFISSRPLLRIRLLMVKIRYFQFMIFKPLLLFRCFLNFQFEFSHGIAEEHVNTLVKIKSQFYLLAEFT